MKRMTTKKCYSALKETGLVASTRGSALVTTAGVTMVVMLAVGGLSTFVLATSHNVRRMAHVVRARAIAEAGANRAYSALRDDFSLRGSSPTNLFPQTEFGGGHYTVNVEPSEGGLVRVISTGQSGSATHRIGVDLRDANYGGGVPPFMEYTIFSNGPMTFNGTPLLINGDLQTNGDFTLSGEDVNIEGMIFAPNIEDTGVSEEKRGEWKPIPFPQLADPEFQEFLDAAREAGTLTEYSESKTFHGDHQFHGITVVDGDVTFQGAGNREIEGMLYVAGDLTANGSTTLKGVILAEGEIIINGASASLTHETDSGTELGPLVVVAGWWD